MSTCPETRGYCECDKPDDGHRFHHCPECATHPNGGHVFAVWSTNRFISSEFRKHESMHEYAYRLKDPWDEPNLDESEPA